MSAIWTPEFVSMIVGIVVSLIVALIPQLESIRAELIVVVGALVGLVIAALGGERVAAARASGSTMAERASVKPYVAPVVKQPPTP